VDGAELLLVKRKSLPFQGILPNGNQVGINEQNSEICKSGGFFMPVWLSKDG